MPDAFGMPDASQLDLMYTAQGMGDGNFDPSLYLDPTKRLHMQLAQQMMQDATSGTPLRSPFQGLARVAGALIGRNMMGDLTKSSPQDQAAAQQQQQQENAYAQKILPPEMYGSFLSETQNNPAERIKWRDTIRTMANARYQAGMTDVAKMGMALQDAIAHNADPATIAALRQQQAAAAQSNGIQLYQDPKTGQVSAYPVAGWPEVKYGQAFAESAGTTQGALPAQQSMAILNQKLDIGKALATDTIEVTKYGPNGENLGKQILTKGQYLGQGYSPSGSGDLPGGGHYQAAPAGGAAPGAGGSAATGASPPPPPYGGAPATSAAPPTTPLSSSPATASKTPPAPPAPPPSQAGAAAPSSAVPPATPVPPQAPVTTTPLAPPPYGAPPKVTPANRYGLAPPSSGPAADAKLAEIAQRESGNQNIHSDPRLHEDSSGLFQISQATWKDFGDPRYKRAMDAPADVQWAAARRIFAARGEQPWLGSNPAYKAAHGGGGEGLPLAATAPGPAPQTQGAVPTTAEKSIGPGVTGSPEDAATAGGAFPPVGAAPPPPPAPGGGIEPALGPADVRDVPGVPPTPPTVSAGAGGAQAGGAAATVIPPPPPPPAPAQPTAAPTATLPTGKAADRYGDDFGGHQAALDRMKLNVPGLTPVRDPSVDIRVAADQKTVDAAKASALDSQKVTQAGDMIQRYLPEAATGWNAELKAKGAKILQGMNVPQGLIDFFTNTNPNDTDVLNKEFNLLAAAAANGQSSNAYAMMEDMKTANPHLDMTHGGIELMTNVIKANAAYQQARSDAQSAWFGTQQAQLPSTGQYHGLDPWQDPDGTKHPGFVQWAEKHMPMGDYEHMALALTNPAPFGAAMKTVWPADSASKTRILKLLAQQPVGTVYWNAEGASRQVTPELKAAFGG